MSRRRELDDHRRKLNEIYEIMNSMKTLSIIETHKLGRVIEAQQAVVGSIAAMANDFFSFNPDLLPDGTGLTDVYLLVGSERGFCGNFNEMLATVITGRKAESQSSEPLLIVVGSKLEAALQENSRHVSSIEGASVVEEIETVMMRIIERLLELQTHYGGLSLTVFYHGEQLPDNLDKTDSTLIIRNILPAFQTLQSDRQLPFNQPPLLNISPREFLLELTDHYLFSTLHEILFVSLLEENRHRVQHLENALGHLDDQAARLRSKSNRLRQEDIIEEIEVILLSARQFSLT